MSERSLNRAAAAVKAEQDAEAAYKAALKARDEAVRAAFLDNPDLGPTALGARIGLGPSTVRALTRHLKE